MNVTTTGKTMYIIISDDHALRIRAMTKSKAAVAGASIFYKQVKNWNPQHSGIFKSNSKDVRHYIAEHKDLKWLNDGKPVEV